MTAGNAAEVNPLAAHEVMARLVPFGLSLSKPSSHCSVRAEVSKPARALRYLRANGANSRSAHLRGEPVDPADVYFRCVPRFETSAPALGWLMERVFLGTGLRRPAEVVMRFFEVL